MDELTTAEEARLRRAFAVIGDEAGPWPVLSSPVEKGAASGTVESTAEEGADAERVPAREPHVRAGGSRRPTTTREATVPDAATPRANPEQAPGDAAVEPTPRKTWWRQRTGAAVLAAAAAIGIGVLTSELQGGNSDRGESQGGQGLTRVEEAACTQTLVQGTVASVRDVPHTGDTLPQVEVDLDVTEWLKPKQGPAQTTMRIPDPVEWNGEEPLKTGDRLLLGDLVGKGDEYYARAVRPGHQLDIDTVARNMREALSEAEEEGTKCPDFWVNRDQGGDNTIPAGG